MERTGRASFVQDAALLRCVADHIHNKLQLHHLCLVNKAFHNAFTPKLYAEMDIITTVKGHNRDFLESLPDNPHIRHVRRLQCDFNHNGPTNWVVRALVRRMPMLQEFEWDGGTLLQETMMTILLSCPKLKSFVMIYEPADNQASRYRWNPLFHQPAEEPAPDPNPPADWQLAQGHQMRPTGQGSCTDSGHCADDEGYVGAVKSALASADMHHLVPFSGLTKLTIAEMDDPMERLKHDWKADILKILLACPDLKELTLSFSIDCIRLLFKDFGCLLAPFLESLCDQYQDSGGKPLKLRALRLGLGLLLAPSDAPEEYDAKSLLAPSNAPEECDAKSLLAPSDAPKECDAKSRPLKAPYLSKLTDITQLQEVYIDNRGKFDVGNLYWPEASQEGDNRIAWKTFSKDSTPNLRQMGLATDVELESLGEFLAPLVGVPVSSEIQNAEIRKRSGLGQVILKLWDTRDYPSGGDENGIFSVLAKEAADNPQAPGPDGQDPIWGPFFGLAASSSRLLVYTRSEGKNQGIFNMDQLEAGLRTLPELRELILGCPMHFGGWSKIPWPQIMDLEPDCMEVDDLVHTFGSRRWRKDVASRLARAGKGLQVVKFGRMAWRVLRGGGEDGSGVTRLLSMDKYEQRRRGCDKGPCSPLPEFAASLIGASFSYGAGVGVDHDARMW
ncbi:hypothetical protein GGTG_04879 [Gaeumannomyces tritici R3-111a-1]|uniref:Uncharacterized protein n=1 Tax=Gaeumannomyces tritici (strain R3-111a-1) TaxID=644352 RepID=J3NUC5_GAET3|nr:hypothetical protein GGTG_04879 [Gaeumannomyces tritici R3-111a-1]EJT79796.1 hypothetical protein GGTG_04879 [Gaeumannomyces tritici R3-111a-1]